MQSADEQSLFAPEQGICRTQKPDAIRNEANCSTVDADCEVSTINVPTTNLTTKQAKGAKK
jgi:hypothetical protein